jgi:predicted small secreted protein
MKPLISMLALSLCLSACASNTVVSVARDVRQGASRALSAPVDHPTLLIKFKQTLRGDELEAFRTRFSLKNVGEIKGLGVFVESVLSDQPVDQILAAIQLSPLVDYAELNGRMNITQPQ